MKNDNITNKNHEKKENSRKTSAIPKYYLEDENWNSK